jgi:hypothetical protein
MKGRMRMPRMKGRIRMPMMEEMSPHPLLLRHHALRPLLLRLIRSMMKALWR